MKISRRQFSEAGLAAVVLGGVEGVISPARWPLLAQGPISQQVSGDASRRALFVNFPDLKWDKILPDWGDKSPEISILHVDSKTQATQLMIRNPVRMHVPRHWHTGNETHTVLRGSMVFECDGKKEEQGVGSFNYIPGKMIHQAWLPDDGLVFITVDAAWDINWVDGPPSLKELGVRP